MIPQTTLRSVTRKIGSGATPRGGSTVYRTGGVSFIRSQNVLDNRMKIEDVARLAADAAHELRGVTVEAGDVLLNITGDSIARCCLVDEAILPARVSQHVAIIRTNDQMDPRFLQRALVNPAMKESLLGMSSGGTRNALTKAMIEELVVPCPDLPIQRAIAEVLGALDDKIAANTALISVADDLAEQKFLAMTINDNVSRPLSSLAQFVNGKAFTKDATGTGRVVIRIAELNSGLGNSTVYNDLDVAEKYLARPGDLLFAWSGSLTVQRWFREEGIVNQHIFKVIPADVPLWVVNGALRAKLAEFRGIAADKATTMGHIQRHHLDEPVLVPDDEAIASADSAMRALWDRALQAERESLKLAELRDTLLPELMSGRLRVKDAERLVKGDV